MNALISGPPTSSNSPGTKSVKQRPKDGSRSTGSRGERNGSRRVTSAGPETPADEPNCRALALRHRREPQRLVSASDGVTPQRLPPSHHPLRPSVASLALLLAGPAVAASYGAPSSARYRRRSLARGTPRESAPAAVFLLGRGPALPRAPLAQLAGAGLARHLRFRPHDKSAREALRVSEESHSVAISPPQRDFAYRIASSAPGPSIALLIPRLSSSGFRICSPQPLSSSPPSTRH